MKIIIYGLGDGRREVEENLLHQHEIVAYTDEIDGIEIFNNKPYYHISKILKMKFDYIVLTGVHRKKSLAIKERLTVDYNIPSDKIVPFYAWADYSIYHNVIYKMQKPIDYIIIGNSMSRYGIEESLFPGNAVNLSCSSQDLFCSTYIVQDLLNNPLTKQLKAIIFDLYDYNMLNIDNSLGTGYLDYICWGGIPEIHNFDDNSNYSFDLMTELLSSKGMKILSASEKTIMKQLFRDYTVEKAIPSSMLWGCLDNDNCLDATKFIGNAVAKRHPETIIENETLIESLLSVIQSKYTDVPVIFTFIPRTYNMEQVSTLFMREWKDEIYKKLDEWKKQYQIEVLDYKACESISRHAEFYYDNAHLNNIGARAFTSLLLNDIKNWVR